MTVRLRPMTAAAARELRAGRAPADVRVADGYPTEFSASVAEGVGDEGSVGPFFIHRRDDDVVVGEIGGAHTEPDTIEIGYAVVKPCWGRGYATEAVRALVEHVSQQHQGARVVAHTPLDRPASGRVLEKAGFTSTGVVDDEHDGAVLTAMRWEHTA